MQTKLRLAYHCALYLTAYANKEKPVSGGVIAARYGLKKRAFESILQRLTGSGLTRSAHGKDGGHYIPDPETVTLADIFQCFTPAPCPEGSDPPLLPALTAEYEARITALRPFRLSDLKDAYIRGNDPPPLDFVI